MLEMFGIKEEPKSQSEDEVEDKKLTIFTYLQDIMVHKKGNVSDRDPSMSKFNTFMILKFLSLDDGYVQYINVLNAFQDILTKEEAYKLLLITIPKTQKYIKFPKKSNSELDADELKIVAKYFECAVHEAEEFVKYGFIGNKDIDKIKEKFGGRI